MNSKLISLSAISSAFVAIILTLGTYIEFIDVFTIVASSIFVTLPLYYKSFKASFLTYLVGGVIAILLSGFNFVHSIVFPAYFAFFGVYPIIQSLFNEKKINKILGVIITLIWFIGVAYGLYFYYTALMNLSLGKMPVWIADNIYWFIALFAIVFYAVFNRFIFVTRRLCDQLLHRIIK